VFIYSINEHKKGQFEPVGLGKLFAKHFNVHMIRAVVYTVEPK
jgi:hypothetical protein